MLKGYRNYLPGDRLDVSVVMRSSYLRHIIFEITIWFFLQLFSEDVFSIS